MNEKVSGALKSYSYAYFIFILALFFYLYDYFIQVSPSVMTQQLRADFSIGSAELGLLGACFYYSYTLMQIPAGLLLDRLGPRKIMSLSALISASGVLLFASAHVFIWAGIGRLLIGAGSAAAFLSALVFVSNWFPYKYFSLMAGMIQFGSCIGSLFALAPLAIAVNHYGWRQTMLVVATLTFLLALIFWLVIKDNISSKENHNSPSIKSNEWARLISTLKNIQVFYIALVGLLCWSTVGAIGALWGVPYLMAAYQWTNVNAAKFCSLFWLGVGIGSPLIGWFSLKLNSRKKPMLICFTIGLIASIVFCFAPKFPPWIVGVSLFGLGFMASIQALTFCVVRDLVDAKLFGSASGLVNMAAILGGGLAQLLIGLIIGWQSQGSNNLISYQYAFVVISVAMAAGLYIVKFKLKETAHS